jgi:hypothetical protein
VASRSDSDQQIGVYRLERFPLSDYMTDSTAARLTGQRGNGV